MDKLTTGLNALRALEAASHKDEPSVTAYALALRNSAPQMLAVIEAAAVFVDADCHCGICSPCDLKAALDALAAVLNKGE